MSQFEQLAVLGEFTGRPEPSEELLERAANYQRADMALDTNPIVRVTEAANRKDYNRFDKESSGVKQVLLFGRMLGRTATAVALTSPAIASCVVAEKRFEKRLRKEYPELLVPSPDPLWSTRPVLARPARDYADALVEQ